MVQRPATKPAILAGGLIFLAWLILAGGAALARPVPVELVQQDDGQWQLRRDGRPFFIQGAGGDGPLDLLAAAGANTIRTWGVGPETGALLDEAQELGLAVIVGHWLGHRRHGFDYGDSSQVAEQYERVRRDVLAHRDHPALLAWGVGNEMEGYEEGDDPAIWAHVQDVAAMIKDLDPHHPTLTVTADIGGGRVAAVHELCPDIDIMGVNSYGGMPSLARRYREAGGTKPLLFTEFGPAGTWETATTSFGAPLELTSTRKAEVYARSFREGCLESGGLCLEALAFTWGHKMEATSTWYGMFLPGGNKLAAVDAMTEVWSGHPPADRCPEIRRFALLGPDVVAPGDTVRVELEVVDPEGAPVSVDWEIRGEAADYFTGGDVQAVPLALDGVIVAASTRGATLVMPGGGLYRLYLRAGDGNGGGATANVPLKVDGPPAPARIKLPLAVYADGQPSPWAPSGWMGTSVALSMDPACKENPRSGETCLRFTYDEPGMWVGVAWQHPANDWGDLPGGFDLTGAEKLTFWARGEEGRERLDFGVGLLTSGKPYHDTAIVKKANVRLKKEWKKFTVKLGGEDLSRIKTPFVWTMVGQGRPLTIYLDDIRFE